MKKIVLIPAYKPDEKLVELVKNINKLNLFDIVVVNDGSPKDFDDIYTKVKEFAHVIEYDTNMGKGHALKTGLKYIKEKYKDKEYVIVTMDADGQHTIKDAINLCNYSEKHPDDLVLGKRLRGKNTPFIRRIGNDITMIVCDLLVGLKVYDTQTGLRAFSNKLIDLMIKIDGNRYEYEMNVLLTCNKYKIWMEEIEIETIYIDDNKSSHFKAVKDATRIYKQILKFSLTSFASFLIDYVLYTILYFISNKLVLSNIIARVISASANYTLNRRVVFNSKESVFKSAVKYILLAITILVLNTLVLNLFTNVVGINAYVSKIITEIILFFFSWTIQKLIVFKDKEIRKKEDKVLEENATK